MGLDDKIENSAEKLGGKAKEAAGKAAGSAFNRHSRFQPEG